MTDKRSTWMLGTAVLSVLVLVAGWFLAISPALATAAETRAEELATQTQNAALAVKVRSLKDQFDHLGESKAKIAGLEKQVPTTAELAAFLRTLDGFAQASGAYVLTISASAPVAVVPAAPAIVVPAAEVPVATDGAAAPAADAGSAAAADVAPVPEVAAVIPGFIAVPVDITVLGTVTNTLAFVTALQTIGDRLYLVTAFNGSGQDAKEASAGRPATAKGDMELAITGFMYVLQNESVAPDAVDGRSDTGLPVDPGTTTPFDAQ